MRQVATASGIPVDEWAEMWEAYGLSVTADSLGMDVSALYYDLVVVMGVRLRKIYCHWEDEIIIRGPDGEVRRTR